MSRDELAARLLALFLTELEEQLAVLNSELLALEAAPRDAARLGGVFRIVHTLKGAANAAHVPEVEEVCHALETLLADAREARLSLGEQEFALLFACADALADARERLRAGSGLADSQLAALRQRLRPPATQPRIQAAVTAADDASARPALPAPRHEAEVKSTPEPEAHPAPPEPAPSGPTFASAGDQVRVEAEKLDALLSAAGQLTVTAGRVAARPAELDELHEFAGRWSADWERSARRLRLAAEGTRGSAAVREALEQVEQNFRQMVRETRRLAVDAREDARALSQAAGEIGARVQRLRLRPFADACVTLPRAVRDLGAATGKEVRLEVMGGDVQADRAVLDLLSEPLLQLVRNAIDHGIEPPDERERVGKPRAGTVTVAATIEGNRLLVRVADDGRGLDRKAIAAELDRRGVEMPETDSELAHLLVQPGFSTMTEATPISGRGVGLDVVATALARAGGSIRIESPRGAGVTFVLECAPSLSTVHALLVTVGAQALAIPSAHVEHVLEVGAEQIRRAEGRSVLLDGEGPVPLVALASLLGPPYRVEPTTGRFQVVRLLVGGRRLAVAVDGLAAVEEIVVRPLERVLVPPPLAAGAALLATGRVALVLNTAALVAAGVRDTGWDLGSHDARPSVPTRRKIVVADDSITTRALEQSILEAAGYDVLTAVDGRDAWRLLQERPCDLLVSDVEMPRMDGFALCAAIRSSPRLARLPVVLVTALDAPEHRERGLDAGADAYLPKSSFDHQDLLDTIQQLLGNV